MYVALRAAEAGAQVVLISRRHLRQAVRESASFWAQGGLAAALAPGDSPERHRQDTLAAGRGLCRAPEVEALVREAPGAVHELLARGVGFDTSPDGSLTLALEAGTPPGASSTRVAARRARRSPTG
jgi:L-aspartate oxidase